VSTRERYSRGWKHIPSKILLLEEKGKAKGIANLMRKLQQDGSAAGNISLVLSLFFLTPGGSGLPPSHS
jgi:hypothetical protein